MSDVGGPQPAGWYRDPHAPETRERYWSGKRWTALRRMADQSPGRPERPPPAEGQQSAASLDNTWVWLAALSPLLAILLVFAAPDSPDVALWVPALASVVAALVDANHVSKAGYHVPGEAIWAVLAVPLYLILRVRSTHSTPLIPITWALSVLVVLAAGNIAAGG